MKRPLLLFFIGMIISFWLQAQEKFEIHYLGNMGIAILHNDSAIIIDGLHDFYGNEYLPGDTASIGAMTRKQKPFSNIVAIAITHRHSDHFDENVVASVAKAHSTALVISGGQTKALLNSDMQKRFNLVNGTATFSIGTNLTINARQIPHTYPQRHSAVENYRIEIIWNGFRLIHLGDADTKAEVITALNNNPDVMVVPSWYFGDEGIPLIGLVQPYRVIATHIAPNYNGMKKTGKLIAEQIFFTKYGDKINISK